MCRWLRSSGYEHFVQAPSADAHVLAAESAVFAGERLHVLIASRLPLRQSAKVAMTAGGYAAFAEVEIAPRKTVLVYTLHCSVRCAAEVRRQEVEAVLHHAAGLEHTTPSADAPAPHQRPRVIGHIVGGDFNQPNEAEYPPGEWRAISKDLAAAGLPASDGVMDAMRAARFTPAWELATHVRPLAPSTAWNGAVVDYLYVRQAVRAAAKTASRAAARTRAKEPAAAGARLQAGAFLRTPDDRPPMTPDDEAVSLKVEAVYVYHSLASDHLPLVGDFRYS